RRGRAPGADRRGAHRRLLALLARRPVPAGIQPPVLRQAVCARLPRDARLEQEAPGAAPSARGARQDLGEVPRGALSTDRTETRRMKMASTPLVGIVMGSSSDWEVMKQAAKQLDEFSVPYEARVLSAHRTPDALEEWVEALAGNGAKCFIAGAGGAAHLAGVIAAKTPLPVLGVPMPSKHLQG